MIRFTMLIISIVLLFSEIIYATGDLHKREYQGFTLWLDCKAHHGAVAFYYEIGRDRRNVSRKSGKFDYDRKVSTTCQPQSWRSYRTTTVNPAGGTWDRGHLVPANHMDNSKATMKESFYLTNTLPQSSTFNQREGAWYQTEIITECYRDITPLIVLGGVIWGNNSENDFFTVTHGIKTPDYWWKLIYRKDKKEVIAWLFPNNQSARASNIDEFLVSIDRLKSEVDFMPDVGSIEFLDISRNSPVASWPVESSGKNLTCEGQTTSSG